MINLKERLEEHKLFDGTFLDDPDNTFFQAMDALEEVTTLLKALRHRSDWKDEKEVNGAIDSWFNKWGFHE